MGKQSAKESASLEDKQLAEALARSASDHSMDTTEATREPTPGTSGATSASATTVTPTKTATPTADDTPTVQDILPTDTFKETDIANMMAMGFSRVNSILELRKVGGDANLALANLFAKSL